MVATSLDSKESLKLKYSRATINQIVLQWFGCTILHEVDALTMDQHPLLLGKIFDRIVFNFPQDVGFAFHKIQNHQKLLLGFLQNSWKMLSRDGEVHVIHVTLSCLNPVNQWEVEKLAEKAGLVLVKKVPFKMQEYPCYTNRRGSGIDWDGMFNVAYSCSTFKFSKGRDVQSIAGT
ncbi:ferredoxin-fold anticodon-binding domain protein [Trifolium repens]|nr:ferredoxin-fold anticodon-binding domain protein [Trifolium repens]